MNRRKLTLMMLASAISLGGALGVAAQADEQPRNAQEVINRTPVRPLIKDNGEVCLRPSERTLASDGTKLWGCEDLPVPSTVERPDPPKMPGFTDEEWAEYLDFIKGSPSRTDSAHKPCIAEPPSGVNHLNTGSCEAPNMSSEDPQSH